MGPDVGQAESGSVRWGRMLARLNLAVSDGSGCWPDWIWLSSVQCRLVPNAGQKNNICFSDKCRRVFLRPSSQMLISVLIQARRLPFKSRPFHYWDHPIIVQYLNYSRKRPHFIQNLCIISLLACWRNTRQVFQNLLDRNRKRHVLVQTTGHSELWVTYTTHATILSFRNWRWPFLTF